MSVFVWRKPDDSWRTWAYEIARAQDERGLRRVTLTFTPLCRDNRSMRFAPNYWPTVEHVMDGLIGAGLIADRGPDHLCRIVLNAGRIEGVDGLEVQVEVED